MKSIKMSSFLLLSFLLFSCSHSLNNNLEKIDDPLRSVHANAENSLYQIGGTWINQDGNPVKLQKLSGKVQVVAMIFTSCGYACPKIVHNMKEIERQLPASVRKETNFLLISFDSKTDTPERLKQYADQRMLGSNWTLLHGTPDEVRLMSMLLNVQYIPLQGGGFNHSNIITILDETGSIYKRIEGLDISVTQAVKEIETATQS
ncbi:MAG TPA: SCO family protein [Chitinophagaceae bacterium]|nr:SCO family protein [Chitinophagaceae bacterium]